jgi:hypothetical protein
MNAKEFSDVTKRLEEVNKVIARLEPEIRNSAFGLFGKYVTSGDAMDVRNAQSEHTETPPQTAVLERLIKEHGSSKPSGNVYLLAADWYSEYGCCRFTLNTIKNRSEMAGLTIPARSDNTLKAATENGKRLFQMDGDGFRPTVHGEIYFKETFKVKKGIKTPPATEVS